jgi:hypothetical protein
MATRSGLRLRDSRPDSSQEPIKFDQAYSEHLRQHNGQNNDQDHDDQQRAAKASRREVTLRIPRPLAQLRYIVIAQLRDGFIDSRVIDFGLLQRLRPLAGLEQAPDRGFVGGTILRGLRRVLVQLVHRDNVLILRLSLPRRARNGAERNHPDAQNPDRKKFVEAHCLSPAGEQAFLGVSNPLLPKKFPRNRRI